MATGRRHDDRVRLSCIVGERGISGEIFGVRCERHPSARRLLGRWGLRLIPCRILPTSQPEPDSRSRYRRVVSSPVVSEISIWLFRHISQRVCPWIVSLSQARAEDSMFTSRELIAGEDAETVANDSLALDQAAFSAAFKRCLTQPATLAACDGGAAVGSVRRVSQSRGCAPVDHAHRQARGTAEFVTTQDGFSCLP